MRLLIFVILFLSFRLTAQEIYKPEKTATEDPTGVSPLLPPTGPSSVAKVFYCFSGGGLRNVYEPESSHLYGITVSSARVFSRTTLSGSAGYIRHHRIKQQYSSLFHPSAPLIAFADSVPGNQNGETYLLSGTVIHRFAPRWTTGITVGYSAGNNAKDTDPRNKNDLSRLEITPGIGFSNSKIRTGMSFSWHRERETISYESFGTEVKNGLTFYPLWFYTAESFSDGTNARRDYRHNLYTISFRFLYRSGDWEAHIRPEYTTGNSRIWINPSTRETAGETAVRSFRLSSQAGYNSQQIKHVLSPIFSHTEYQGYDIQQKKENNSLAYTDVLKIKRSGVTYTTAGISYLLSPSQHKHWQADLSFEYSRRHSLFRMYPTDFRQNIARIAITAGYSRRFEFNSDYLDCGLQQSYSSGSGQQPDMEILSGTSTTFRPANSLQTREYHYLTAPAAATAVKLKYTWPSQPARKTGFYLEISNHFRYTLPRSVIQSEKYTLQLSSGVLF